MHIWLHYGRHLYKRSLLISPAQSHSIPSSAISRLGCIKRLIFISIKEEIISAFSSLGDFRYTQKIANNRNLTPDYLRKQGTCSLCTIGNRLIQGHRAVIRTYSFRQRSRKSPEQSSLHSALHEAMSVDDQDTELEKQGQVRVERHPLKTLSITSTVNRRTHFRLILCGSGLHWYHRPAIPHLRRKLQMNISYQCRHKNPQQKSSELIKQHIGTIAPWDLAQLF